jgi:hypothetical protein
MITRSAVRRLLALIICAGLSAVTLRAANPIITNVFTADPAAMVCHGTVYRCTGELSGGVRRLVRPAEA